MLDKAHEENIANNTGISPDESLETGVTKLKKDSHLETYLLKNFKISRLMSYWPVPQLYKKTLANDLQLKNSLFLNRDIYSVPEIPKPDMDNLDDSESKLEQIFEEFPFFKFGGVPFVCTHDYLWGNRPGLNGHAKDMFEIRYGIKLSDVYISLNELQSVASFNSLFTVIDDFFVTGNHDDTVLTVVDNNLPYGAKESSNRHECHFRPVFCLDQGIPVKYIKTADDNGKLFSSQKYESEQRHKYAEQRNYTLKKLGEFYKTNSPNDNAVVGYPTDIDFVVKTGLCEFTFLCYDRFSKSGDFFITNVCYDNDGKDLKYVINRCDFKNLPQQIKAIQCARVKHFNKMYGLKEKSNR